MDDKKGDAERTADNYRKVHEAVQELVEELAARMPSDVGAGALEVVNFRNSILEETDRGAVLMSAAFLDDKLKELIQKRLVHDTKVGRRAFEFNGPLGTFASRIDFAYLLGILPKNAWKDLHLIRKIRNEFAHSAAPLTYENEKVKSLCDRLVFHGVKDVAEAGSKFRRSVVGLLTHVTFSTFTTEHIEALADYAIPDRTDAYRVVSKIFEEITGEEYPLKHEHE